MYYWKNFCNLSLHIGLFYLKNLNTYKQFGSSSKCQIGLFCATPSKRPPRSLLVAPLFTMIRGNTIHFLQNCDVIVTWDHLKCNHITCLLTPESWACSTTNSGITPMNLTPIVGILSPWVCPTKHPRSLPIRLRLQRISYAHDLSISVDTIDTDFFDS